MNKQTKQLVEQAGFILWADEDWKPEGAVVDWSSDYDKELETLIQLVVKECAEVAGCNGHVSGFTLGDLIKEHFKGE